MHVMKKARSLSTRTEPSKVSVSFLSEPIPISESFFSDSWELRLRPVVTAVLRGQFRGLTGKRELLYREVERLVKLQFTHKLTEKLHVELDDYCQSLFQESISVELVVQLFEQFVQSLDALVKIFNPLDRELRYLFSMSRDSEQQTDLQTIGFSSWRRSLCAESNDQSLRLIDHAISQIECARRGETGGESIAFISKIINLLVKIGIYIPLFEAKHLARTKSFYANSACGSSLVSYLDYVSRTFVSEEELHRAIQLPQSTWKMVNSEILRTELILERLPALIQADLVSLVRSYDVTNLQLLFNICNMLSEKLITESVLKYSFGESLAKVCHECILLGPLDASCIDRLVQFRGECQGIITRAFACKPSFVNAFKDSVESVINNPDLSMFPALLATWMDLKFTSLMDREQLMEASGPAWLTEIIGLFKLVAAKDVFEAHYRSLLGKRLIYIASNFPLLPEALNLESSSVALLRSECGAGYTNKLECMLKDIAAAGAVEDEERGGEVDLRVFVVTSGVWPNTLVAWSERLKVPAEVERAENDFIKRFSAAHPKKSLKFVHAMTSAVVRFKRKELVCSASQALILCLFNETDSVDKLSIITETRIPENEVSKALPALIDATLLTCENEIFSVNTQFRISSGVSRIVLNQYQFRRSAGSTFISDEERSQTESSVNEDRQHQLDAAIVRTMKRVKKCLHAFLVADIMESTKYLFSKNEISKRVASLVDREFLERDSGDDGEIRYLA